MHPRSIIDLTKSANSSFEIVEPRRVPHNAVAGPSNHRRVQQTSSWRQRSVEVLSSSDGDEGSNKALPKHHGRVNKKGKGRIVLIPSESRFLSAA